MTGQLRGSHPSHTPSFNLHKVRAVRQGFLISLVSNSWSTSLTHSLSLHLTEVGGRSPSVHLVLGHVPLRPTEVGGHCRWPATQVAGGVSPSSSLYTSTVAGESAGSSVAFSSSFFSLATGRTVSQKVPCGKKVPCGLKPRRSLVARKSLVASNQGSPLWHLT